MITTEGLCDITSINPETAPREACSPRDDSFTVRLPKRRTRKVKAMKIYRFVDVSSHDRAGNEGLRDLRGIHGKDSRERSSSHADSVEISPEARRKYQNTLVMEMDGARRKKLAAEYNPVVHRRIEQVSDLPSMIDRTLHVRGIHDSVRRGTYDFDSPAATGETADNVLAQLLGV